MLQKESVEWVNALMDDEATLRYWRQVWNRSDEPDYAAWRFTQATNKLRFCLGLLEATSLDLTEAKVFAINDGPIGCLEPVKARCRIAVDPLVHRLFEAGLLPFPRNDGEVCYLSAPGARTGLPTSFFDYGCISCPVQDLTQAIDLCREATRITRPGGSIAVNLTVPTIDGRFFERMTAGLDGVAAPSWELVKANAPTVRGRLVIGGARTVHDKTDLIRLQHPLPIQPRHTSTNPNAVLARSFARLRKRFETKLEDFRAQKTSFGRISTERVNDVEPYWRNGYLPILDGIALYCELAARNPKYFVEIGCGHSTKFASRAIRDHNLQTQIILVDPQPQPGVESLCHKVFRSGLEGTDLQDLRRFIGPGTVLFFDGSHYLYQNSDTCVFFLEVLPFVPPAALVGIHNIMLPYDYPNRDMKYYNEQYMLAPSIVSRSIEIEFASFYISLHECLSKLAFELLGHDVVQELGAWCGGSSMWFRTLLTSV